jgi:hypothetical protein
VNRQTPELPAKNNFQYSLPAGRQEFSMFRLMRLAV